MKKGYRQRYSLMLIGAAAYLVAATQGCEGHDTPVDRGAASSRREEHANPLQGQVSELVRRLEHDYEIAPGCLTSKLSLFDSLRRLGSEARPFIQAEAERSPVGNALKEYVLSQM